MDARKPAAAFLAAAFTALVICSSGASYRTPNFVVEAATSELAEEIGRMAERYRHDLAIDWLGAALPNWGQPCPIHAQVAPQLGAGGATTFTFDHSEVFGWHMEIQGSHERLLDSVLPHEVTHTIFASHFRRPLPRWADEGACTTVEDISERSKQDRMLIQFLHTGRGIAFSQMFAMTDYPQDILPLYAQGYSLARFLMEQKGKREFLTYVGDGMSSGNWVAATNQHYGYKNLAVLQETWLEWVKQGSPARSPDASRASGNLALASKGGAEQNVIVRAQSSDRSTRAIASGVNNGETQWAPVARQAPVPMPPMTAAPVTFPVAAPIRNGSVAMDTSAANPQPMDMAAPLPAPGKSVYGEGVGLIHHSADFQSDSAANAAPAAASPAANPAQAAEQPTARSQTPRDRRILLEWTRQQ